MPLLTDEVVNRYTDDGRWIEHRLFSFITMNWRGKPLIRHEVMVGLIAATTNTSGLTVRAGLDRSSYPPGRKVRKAEMEALKIERGSFHHRALKLP